VSAGIGVGIIGSGLQAETYAASLAGHVPDARFVAIWGGSRAPELAAAWGGEAVGSAEAVVDHPDVDLVIVTTPNASHPQYGHLALDAGRHVAMERPIAATAADAAALEQHAAERGLLFTTLQTGRNVAAAQAAKRALEAGAIGAVRMAQLHWTGTSYPVDRSNWRARPEHGGLFLDVGEHAFDLLAWLIGAEIERVHARVTDFAGQGRETSAMAQVEFANGALGQVWISFEIPWPGLPKTACRALLVGDTGILDIDSYGETWLRRAARLGRAPASYLESTDYGHADLGTGDHWERLVDEQPSDSSAVAVSDLRRIGKFIAHLREIVDGLLGRGSWPTEGHDGVRAIAAVEACRRSSASGLPEPVTAVPSVVA
jgi:predicted dehydrogenase